MNAKVYIVNDPADWTWLLRVPVREGDPVPFEILMMYHANTLLPMRQRGVANA